MKKWLLASLLLLSLNTQAVEYFPLDQVRAAHRYFDTGDHVGKVLLVM